MSTYSATESIPSSELLSILPLHQDTNGEKLNDGFDQLEFDYFARILGERFEQSGYKVSEDKTSDLVVYLAYDVERQEKNDSRPVSFYGRFGYFYRYGSVVFIDEPDRDQFEFVRKVKLKIERKNASDDSEPLLSLTAVSKGQCGHLGSVYDEMLEAIFSNLNRPNGSVIRLRSKSNGPCVRSF